MSDRITDPNDLLFEKHIYGRGEPLFKTRSELAQAIKKLPGTELNQRPEESIRAYLSQVLKPGSASGSRPLSENFRDAILAVCSEKISNDENIADFKIKFKEAFDNLRMAKESPQPRNSTLTLTDLESKSKKAKHHVIFTIKPAEITESRFAKQLRDDMIENLFLHDEPETKKIEKTYEFFVSSKSIAVDFWQRLYGYLTLEKACKEIDASKNLEWVNSGACPKLSISVVDSLYCCFSTLVLDPRSSDSTGYNMYYHRDNEIDEISIAQISSDYLALWFDKIYLPSQQNGSVEVEKVTWKSIKPQEQNKEEELNKRRSTIKLSRRLTRKACN